LQFKICLKSDKNVGTLHEDLMHLYCWQQHKIFCSSTTVARESIVAFPWQH